MPRNSAKPLTSRIWGVDSISGLPLKWRSAIKYRRVEIPGVPLGTDPDELGTNGVINSQVLQKRLNELDKTTETLESSLIAQHTYHEQDYDEQFDVVIPTDSFLTLEGANLGNPRTRIVGLIPGVDEVTTISPNTTVLDNYLIEFPGTATIDAPDFLESLQVLTESSLGDGDSTESTVHAEWSGDYSVTLPARSTAQGSAAITKEVVPILVPFSGYRRNTRNFIFFLPNPVLVDAVATKLASLTGLDVVAWSNFQARPLTIIVISKRVSLQVGASLTMHAAGGGGSISARVVTGGTSASREVAITTKTIRVPPTIHGDLGLTTGLVSSSPITVSAIVQIVPPSEAGYTKSRTISDEVATVTVEAFGLAATTGASSLPTEGLLIVDVNARPYKYGRVMINVEAIDASTL
jgi:hypothetical protein